MPVDAGAPQSDDVAIDDTAFGDAVAPSAYAEDALDEAAIACALGGDEYEYDYAEDEYGVEEEYADAPVSE